MSPNMKVTLTDIKRAIAAREIDLRLAAAPEPYSLCIKGEFDHYAHFFTILLRDVEYLDIAGGFTVGDIEMTDATKAAEVAPKWRRLTGLYSGPTLLIRSADSESWESATSSELFAAVANTIEFEPGPDWPNNSPDHPE